MSREFYVPCTPYAYPECNSEPEEQIDGGGGGGGGSSSGVDVDVDVDGDGDADVDGGVVVVSNDEGVTGMDCMPLRPGPFHYLISEQAKSLVALQELQNEVGALLEFRDLVIETFPNLRHKMAGSSTVSVACSVTTTSSSNQSSNSHMPLPLSSPSSNIHHQHHNHHQHQHHRRIGEWEPGKIRRRIVPRDAESSASSLPRSRSNSHSGGSKNSATVQDSGFSTETSSKDSASTAIQSTPIRPTSPKPILDEAEDELWNLLDVIHRKGVKLREEVESLQGKLKSVAPNEIGLAGDILEAIKKVTDDDDDDDDEESNSNNSNNSNNFNCNCNINNNNNSNDNCHELTILKREKKQLLDRVIELEAETISSRVKAQQLQIELAALTEIKNSLENRLINKLNQQDDNHNDDDDDDNDDTVIKQKKSITIISSTPISSPKHSNRLRNKTAAFDSVNNIKSNKNRFRTRTIEKNVLIENGNVIVQSEFDDIDPVCAAQERRLRLGALDSILISPTRLTNVKNIDSHKIAAILKEHSPFELQRHLITTTVHNQCLQMRLNEIEKSTDKLSDKLDKTREENDDLRFQLEERNIELEGTRARVRVLEKLQQRTPTEHDPDGDGGGGDLLEIDNTSTRYERSCLEQGSSTESARDHEHVNSNNNINIINNSQIEVKPSPRRRPPSRIPLPGVTKSTAPKPPSNIINTTKTDCRESLKSLKSLTTRPPRDSSRDSITGNKSSSSLTKTRDSSRESLNKSLPKNTITIKDNNNRESLNKSSFRNSLNKSSSLSRARDSLESANNHNSNNQQQQQQQQQNLNSPLNCWTPPTSTTTTLNNINNNINNSNSNSTTSKRPLAPARRSQSLARTSVDTNDTTGKAMTDPPSSWCSSTISDYHQGDVSLYLDSLNQDNTSLTGSTKIEFIIGSPTRRFRPNSAWQNPYFDSIDSGEIAESLSIDEFPPRCGEALAECDSLEKQQLSSNEE